MTEALLVITGALCVSLIVVLISAYKHINRVEGENKSLIADSIKLKAQLKKEADDRDHCLRQLAAYYDERVEGK